MQSLSVAERDVGLTPSEIQSHLLGPPRVARRSQLLAIPRSPAHACCFIACLLNFTLSPGKPSAFCSGLRPAKTQHGAT